MTTIRDVAKLAGVSVATVSIVMNNKSKERSIPEATQTRITNAMRELGYQPNLSARRLRSKYKQSPVIVFFWPLDFRITILASFMNAFSREIQDSGFECELVIQTYESGKLEDYDEALTKRGYNGVIIGACTEDDIKHLESLNLLMPVILVNRESEKFSTVSIDNDLVGKIAAREFVRKGFRNAGVFASNQGYLATNLRVESFLKYCKFYGVSVEYENIIRNESTFDGGYYIAGDFCGIKDRPRGVFCDSDAIAVGALRAFNDMNINIPKDLELLTIDMNVSGTSAYSSPSLSVIELPNEEIGSKVINLMSRLLSTSSPEIEHLKVKPRLILRESFT